MGITEETVRDELTKIKNQYNSYRLGDEELDHFATFIIKDRNGKERSEKEKEDSLRYTLYENYRELVKEGKFFDVVKSKGNRYFIYSTRYKHPMIDFYLFKDREEEIMKEIMDTADAFNKIYEQGYVESEVEFPSGNLIFVNFFMNPEHNDHAFAIPDDIQYKEINSINHLLGEQNIMRISSELHGLGYVQLGNTSAQIFKVSDDKIVMTNSYFEDYNDYTDEVSEIEIPVPKDWELLGEICCDMWRVEFIDQVNFDKGNVMALDHKDYQFNEPFRGKVNPGKWRVRNRYHLMDDDKEMKAGRIPIWVEMERIQDAS